MKKPHDLFLLIKGMSKAEKGYFKKYTSLHIKGVKNNYIKLFDLLSKSDEYNEEELKKKLKNNPVANYLSSAKIYLYNLILKSLRAYYSDTSVEVKIFENMLNADILKKKSLIDQSNKALQNAYELAETQENFALLVRIHEKKLSNLLLQADSQVVENYAKDRPEQLKVILENIREIIELDTHTLFFIRQLLSVGLDVSPENTLLNTNTSQIDSIHDIALPSLKNDYRSFKAKLKSLEVKRLLCMHTNDFEGVVNVHMQIFKLLDADPTMKKRNWLAYASRMCNYIYYLFLTGKLDEAEKTFEKINEHVFYNLHEQIYVCSYAYVNILHAYIHSGNIDKASSIRPNILRMMEKYKDKMPIDPATALNYNLGTLLFIQQEYSQAIRWNNAIINLERKKTRQDIHEIAEILNILLHYEQKNYDLVESLIESLQRKITKHASHFNFTAPFLKHFKKICITTDASDLLQKFELLKEEMLKHPIKVGHDEYLLIAWLDSKIHKKSIQELLTEAYSHVHGTVHNFH